MSPLWLKHAVVGMHTARRESSIVYAIGRNDNWRKPMDGPNLGAKPQAVTVRPHDIHAALHQLIRIAFQRCTSKWLRKTPDAKIERNLAVLLENRCREHKNVVLVLIYNLVGLTSEDIH